MIKPCAMFLLFALPLLSGCFGQPDFTMKMILERAINSGSQHQEIKTDLKKCLKDCSKEEKVLAKEILTTFLPTITDNDSVTEKFITLNSIFRKSFKVYQKDAANLHSAYRAAATHVQYFLTQGEDFLNLRDEVIKGLKQLAEKSTSSAEVISSYADFVFLLKDDVLESTKQYIRCLKLDPENERCRKGYNITTRKLKQPHCKSANVQKKLVIFLASTNRSQGKKYSFEDKHYYKVTDDILSARDFSKIFYESVENGATAAVFKITPQGSKRLEEATAVKKNQKELNQHILVALDDVVLSVFPHDIQVATTYLSILSKGEPKEFLRQLCQRISSTLPKNLIISN